MSGEPPPYAANLVLAGRPCLVVGAGRVAARKIAGLLASGAVVTVVAPDVSAEVAALPVDIEKRPYERGEVARYWLVVTATDDPAVNRAVFEDGRSARVFVNSADDPANCSVTLPAVVRRGDVTVAVSTGGRSPALATWMRRRLEAEIGPEYDLLAGLLHEAREAVHAGGRSTEEIDWQKLLDSGMLDLIRAGKVEEAKERLQACLSSS